MTQSALTSQAGLHVAVIMDGNGRWATARGLPRTAGHVRGAEAVRRTVEAAPDLGIRTLSLYAFSSDNWRRPTGEVRVLLRLFARHLRSEPPTLAARGASATSPRRPTRTPRGGHEMSRAWIPRAMRQAPPLDPSLPAPPMERGRALLINPFYAKDPHASFGKHVLTPTLALTSVAGATPAPWRVTYWDENLLAGRPPFDPMPEVVGITVHLTFARRAYALAAWYRARGARVIL